MSGLTSLAASPVALPAMATLPSAHAPSVPSLAAFLDLMIGKIVVPTAKGAAHVGERQDDAATGKYLPGEDKAQIDPALAWLFGAMPIEPLQAAKVALPTGPNTPVICAVEPEVPPTLGVLLLPVLDCMSRLHLT